MTQSTPAMSAPIARGAAGSAPAARPRVVIIGAGFAGLAAAQKLARARCDVVLIDRQNYHLFQPLLYQVATAGLSPAAIASPIRAILRRQCNASVVLDVVTGIDRARRQVLLGTQRIGYDHLVVATGARHAYFGNDGWEAVAPGLKTIEDATAIRRKILLALEAAENAADADERCRLMTFVVIGGGPTGVELSGAVAELARAVLKADFRRIDPSMSRVVLVEGGPRLLASFPARLSAVAQASLERLGVEVRLGAPVTGCDADGVSLGDERLQCRTILWAAGVAASPAAAWLGATSDRSGRVFVAPDLTLPGDPAVFVIGDTAHAVGPGGNPLPGVAAVAKQQGEHVARAIAARLSGRRSPGPFRYRNLGNLATIGRKAAVADFGYAQLRGRVAWLLWGAVHIYFLIGFRNRSAVILDWLWAYLTLGSGARLITEVAPSRHGEKRLAARTAHPSPS